MKVKSMAPCPTSNRDVLLKFLQQPHSLFTTHLHDLQDAGHFRFIDEFWNESERESPRKKSIKSNHKQPHDLHHSSRHGRAFSGHSVKISPIPRRKDEPKHLPAKIVLLKPDIQKSRSSTGNFFPSDSLLECSDRRESRARKKKFLDKEVSSRRSYEESSDDVEIMRNRNLEGSSKLKESSINREAKKRLSDRWKKTRKSEEKRVLSKGRTLADMFAAHDNEVIMADSDEEFLNKFSIDEQVARGAEPLVITNNDGSSQLIRYLISRESYREEYRFDERESNGLLQKIQVNRVRDEFLDDNSLEMSFTDSDSSFQSADYRTPDPQNLENLRNFMSSRIGNSGSCHQESLVPQEGSSEESPFSLDKSVAKFESLAGLKEGDQPSPVSVLEHAFRDDLSSSSEYFESISADLQGLQMQHLNPLNLQSEAFAEGSMALPEAKENWELCYLSEILKISGLENEVFLEKWHSSDHPINPLIFEELEKRQSHLGYTTSSDRRLLFDLINWGILGKPARTVQNAATWMKNGIHVSICKFLETLKNSIEKDDVVNEAKWLDLGDEIDEIVGDLERMMMDELFAEIYSENVMHRFLEELKSTSKLW